MNPTYSLVANLKRFTCIILSKKNNLPISIFAILFIIFLCFAQPSYSRAETDIEKEGSRVSQDSLVAYPEKIPSEERWEKVVNFPGRILFTPFHITFMGAEAVAEHIITLKVVQRIAETLTQYKPKYISFKYSSRHGAGIAYNQRNIANEGSKFDVSGQWGLKSRHRYRMRLKGLQLGKRFSTDIVVWRRFLSNESFYGLGNDTKESDESSYGLKQMTAEVTLNGLLTKRLTIGAIIGLDDNDVVKGRDNSIISTTELYSETELPGVKITTTIARMQAQIKYNGLNKPVRPTGGGLLVVNSAVFKDFGNDTFNFWKLSASYKHFIHLFFNRTIALRIAGERTNSFSGKKVPFYYLTEIGSEETVRGFTRDRFRDGDMVLASIEYTYHIYRNKADALVFLDSGQVSSDIFDDFSLKDFHTGYGAGINVWGSKSISVQAMIGVSDERLRYYLSWNKQY